MQLLIDIERSVFLRGEKLVIIDRRALPGELLEFTAGTCGEVARAIEDMVVQGSGDIAITAGYGLYLEALELEKDTSLDIESKRRKIRDAAQMLIGTRPTGFHMAALLDKITGSLSAENSGWPGIILESINRAVDLQRTRSRQTGQRGAYVLEDGDTILTHCFPGAGLLYMLLYAREQGKKIKVFSCETRPYLQGARLTAWSLSELDFPVKLITDNMAAYCMTSGMISKVFTAADRIAMDGTVANKIGTLQLAIVADYCGIPFYVLGYGGPDRKSGSAADINIEMRDPEEVLCFKGTRITGQRVEGFYPAFDLTPARFVKGIVTDRGIFTPAEIGGYWTAGK